MQICLLPVGLAKVCAHVVYGNLNVFNLLIVVCNYVYLDLKGSPHVVENSPLKW